MTSMAAAIAAAMLLATAPHAAIAGSMQVQPIVVTLQRAWSGQVIVIRNTGDTPLTMQASVSQWSETAGAPQVLVPATDVTASPALFTVAPGATRQVRVGTTVAASNVERAYRLLLRELRTPSAPGPGVSILTNVDIPVFVAAAAPARADVHAVYARVRDGGVDVTVRNTGNTHARYTQVDATVYDGLHGVVATGALDPVYVLAGSECTMHVRLSPREAARVRTVQLATTDMAHGVATIEAPVVAVAAQTK